MLKGLFGRRKKKEEILQEESKQQNLAENTEQYTDSKNSLSDFAAAQEPPLSENAQAVSEESACAEEESREEDRTDMMAADSQKPFFEEDSHSEISTPTVTESDASVPEAMEKFQDKSETADEETAEETAEETKKSHQGFFSRLKESLSKTRSAITERVDTVLASFKTVDEELFEELEEALIMADIGVDTSLYIIGELRKRAKEQGIKEAAELKGVLKEIISEILIHQNSKVDTSKKPTVIMVIGVNGVGKTTSIGKLAARFRKEGKKVILAAADTFRAAAIDQLQIWAERSDAEIVKHQEGSDPSSVVFDAIAAAKSRNADIVICDTAGRLHNKKNLMEELKKTARVIERETGNADNEVLLVLDGSTGQNALIQAKEFAAVANITGVILTKLDGTAKGGVVIALSREQNIGVKYIGVGEGIDDLQEFNPQEFADALFPETEDA